MLAWILVGVALMAATWLGIWCIIYRRDLIEWQEKVKELSDKNDQLQDENNQYGIRYQEVLELNNYLKEQLKTSLWNIDNKENELNSRYVTLTNNVAAAEARLREIDAQVENRTQELNNVAAQFKGQYEKFEEMRAQGATAACKLEGYKNELKTILEELDNAKITQRAMVLDKEDGSESRFDFVLSGKEKKLITTIAEITAMYPELSKDLATIEWKKVWLSRFQDLANREGLGVRGIYRLVLKADENISYVGQAVNIKERWYEHVKKMIGADNKGNEKLYEYRPEDFYWTVLEKGNGDLNRAERYWIEYYCCKEVGLNKV